MEGSAWAEIRNDYMEEGLDNGFFCVTIDAWKSGDSNEEGEVIARVFGKWHNSESIIFAYYRDFYVESDPYVQEMVKDAKEKLDEHLRNTSQKGT